MKNVLTMMLCSLVAVATSNVYAASTGCPSSLATKQYMVMSDTGTKVSVVAMIDGYQIEGDVNVSGADSSNLRQVIEEELSNAKMVTDRRFYCIYSTPRGNKFIAETTHPLTD